MKYYLCFVLILIILPFAASSHDIYDYIPEEVTEQLSSTQVAAIYSRLGFDHILPKGSDHILFVLGLFLLSSKFKTLLLQVSMFTVAHTITLALTINNMIALPAHIVEPLIALSIVFIAIENVFISEMKPWRPFVIFAFGLLHGMGFAGVLAKLGMPQGHFMTSLISFNIGVELGQLVVVLIAFFTIGRFRNRKWYRDSIVIPASTLIALVGLYWTVSRVFLSE
ncbi:MAG: HupE/UreJ family protein [Spirochaetota bacterium]